MAQDRYQQAKRVTIIGIILNALLSIVKLIVGVVGQSQALLADGIHSLSDLITDAFVLWAARAANQAPDADHPYGHGRFETLATVLLAVLLLVVGVGIAWDGCYEIFSHSPSQTPSVWVLIVAFISVIVNEVLYRITHRVGEAIRSDMLKANAWHNRGDALSSLVVLIGAGVSILGVHYGDAIAAIIVALLIIKMAINMIWRNLRELVDTGVDKKLKTAFEETISTVEGVVAIHMLRSRLLAGEIYLDVHVQVAPKISVSEGHYISDKVISVLRNKFSHVKDVTVHIDPEDDEEHRLCCDLPSRKQVEYVLSKADLPQYQRLSLHYLDGELFVEMTFPKAESVHHQTLLTKLQAACRHFGCEVHFSLFFD